MRESLISYVHDRSIPGHGRIYDIYAGRAATPGRYYPYRLLTGIDDDISSVCPFADLKVDSMNSWNQVECHGLAVGVLVAGACGKDRGDEENARMLRIESDDQVGAACIILGRCCNRGRCHIASRSRCAHRCGIHRRCCRSQTNLLAAQHAKRKGPRIVVAGNLVAIGALYVDIHIILRTVASRSISLPCQAGR